MNERDNNTARSMKRQVLRGFAIRAWRFALSVLPRYMPVGKEPCRCVHRRNSRAEGWRGVFPATFLLASDACIEMPRQCPPRSHRSGRWVPRRRVWRLRTRRWY